MEEPIRILQVHPKMYPSGAENLVMNLYRHINRERVQFDFVVHTDEKQFFDDEIYSQGGRIYHVPVYKGYNHLQYMAAWKKLLLENKAEYRIIHSHIRSTAAFFLKEARKQGYVTIAHSHSTSEGSGMKAYIKKQLEKKLRENADYCFACSTDAGKWLFGEDIVRDEHFFVLKNAIDVKRFKFNNAKRNEARKKLGFNEEFVLGHVGRFFAPKNHVFIIEIFKEIKHKYNPDAKLLLVGDGELQDKIKILGKSYGLGDDIVFAGNRSDVAELMMAMDCFVFPSKYEGLPVTLVEAQCTGLPCIVSDVITDEVDLGTMKKISLSKSADVWAENVISMKNNIDKRINGTEAVQNHGFDIEKTAKWIEDFYCNL